LQSENDRKLSEFTPLKTDAVAQMIKMLLEERENVLIINPTWRRLDRQRNIRNGFPCPNCVGGGRRLKTKLFYELKF